jgi:hypothetical protein
LPDFGTAHGHVRYDAVTVDFETDNIEGELLQLDISGGMLPAGMMIRESPTLASPGHSDYSVVQFTFGTFFLRGFFDVFTELSLDGGQTWSPAHRSARLDFQAVTPTPTRGQTWGTLKLLYRH